MDGRQGEDWPEASLGEEVRNVEVLYINHQSRSMDMYAMLCMTMFLFSSRANRETRMPESHTERYRSWVMIITLMYLISYTTFAHELHLHTAYKEKKTITQSIASLAIN